MKRGQNVKYLPYAFTEQGVAHKLTELERRIESHDTGIQTLFEAMRQLMAPPPPPPKRPIGFRVYEKSTKYRTRVKPQGKGVASE